MFLPARRCLALAFAFAFAGALSMSASAEARPVPWGGTSFNDLGPASVALTTQNGSVTLSSLQLIMACTDTADGTESARAYSIATGTRVTLRRNRFAFSLTAESGGRVGQVRLTGVLRSNGTGTARADVDATGTDSSSGAVIERCGATVNFRLRRQR